MKPSEILQTEFSQRKNKNPRYSLRAFAKALGIQPPSLSAILRNQRPFPVHEVEKVLSRLQWQGERRLEFVASVRAQDLQNPLIDFIETPILTEQETLHAEIIAEWEYAAVLALIDSVDFQPDVKWISQRLNIDPARAQVVRQNLLLSGLVVETSGKWSKRDVNLRTSDEVQSQALRKAHADELKKALEKLASVPLEERDYTSNTILLSQADLKKFKSMVRAFHKNLEESFQNRQMGDEVYQVCIQAYPISKKITEP